MEYLMNLVSRLGFAGCVRENEVEDSQERTEVKKEKDVLNFCVPRREFIYFKDFRPEGENLSLEEFMHLYRYVGLAAKPRSRYEYVRATYTFNSEGKVFIFDGWVPRIFSFT